ncbi:hypothetical protein D918_01040 [Trichuris suis]|nr:hypothetical protein D918_01040 [Trichuris suis]
MKWTEEDSYLHDGWTVETAMRHYVAVYCEKFKCRKHIQDVMTTMADNEKYTLALIDAAECQSNCREEFSGSNTTRRIAYLYVKEVYLPKKKEYLKKAGLAE